MAARLNTRQTEKAKSHIKTNRILEELGKVVFEEREMTATQLRAAEILLNKTIPNLKAIEVAGKVDHKLEITWKS